MGGPVCGRDRRASLHGLDREYSDPDRRVVRQGEVFGEQLELPFEGGLERLSIPWDGRSPRALTRVGLSRIFKAQDVKKREQFVLSGQYDLWPTDEKAAPYLGAVPLLPLPRRWTDG